MKHNQIIILSIILVISLTFSVLYRPSSSMEGLNVRKHNTDTLFRNEYIDEQSFLISKNMTFMTFLRNGKLACLKKNERPGPMKLMWIVDAPGAKLLLLNNMGNLMFKDSKTKNTITSLSSTNNGQKLLLTSYGDLELRDENDEKIWGQNDSIMEGFVEGNDPADVAADNILDATKTLKEEAQKQMMTNLAAYYNNPDSNGLGSIAADTWNQYKTDISGNLKYDNGSLDVSGSITNPYTDNSGILTDFNNLDSGIEGGHDTLLQTAREMRRKRNVLDNKVKELNQLGDSHVSEKNLHLDTTIYIGLAWTVAASGLVYYTLTQ